MAEPVRFTTAIKPLFRQIDIDHMKPYNVYLNDYNWMSDPADGTVGDCDNFADHAHARSVLAFLKGACIPQMPIGGPFWDQAKLDFFEQWMEDGFQE